MLKKIFLDIQFGYYRKVSQKCHIPEKCCLKWRVGTSGWNYPHWKNVFYPPGLPQTKWLEFYTNHFDTVEVNATFYRLPNPETFKRWYERTPAGFIWAIKGNKYITHTKRLRDSKEPLQRLYKAVRELREKVGPILFQLPPSLSFDQDVFRKFCDNLDFAYPHVLEIRHPSWICEPVFQILKDKNVAFCLSETAGQYPYHEVLTADFLYIRLHGSKTLYASKYTEGELQGWVEKLRAWNMETYLYFDNDYQGHAVEDATRLKEILVGADLDG